MFKDISLSNCIDFGNGVYVYFNGCDAYVYGECIGVGESMDAWLLSIVGVVFVGVVFDMMIPEGKVNGIIRSIFSIATLFVLLQPVPKLIKELTNKQWDMDVTFQEVGRYNEEDILVLQQSIQNELIEIGYNGVDVVVGYDNTHSTNCIQNVYIDLSSVVLNMDKQHIVEYEDIKEVVCRQAQVTKEQVIIYGKGDFSTTTGSKP